MLNFQKVKFAPFKLAWVKLAWVKLAWVKPAWFLWMVLAFLCLWGGNSLDAAGVLDNQSAIKAIAKMNQYRQQKNLQPLKQVEILNQVASLIAEDAVAHQNDKVQKINLDLSAILRKLRYPSLSKGSIVMASNLSPEAQITNLFQDPKYQAMLVKPEFTEIGLVAIKDLVKDSNNQGTLWALIMIEPSYAAKDGWMEVALYEINQFRKEYSLPPLKINGLLTDTAMTYSKRMAIHDFVAHDAPEGDRIGQRVTQSGYPWQVVYENLQAGAKTPEEAVEAWKLSKKGHREAMLSKDTTEMGIGYYFMPFDDGKIISNHYWTLIMAKPK